MSSDQRRRADGRLRQDGARLVDGRFHHGSALSIPAGRAGIKITLADFDTVERETPVPANLRPAGKFLMVGFHDAGGIPALLSRLRDRLHLDCKTVSGQTLGEVIARAEVFGDEVIVSRERPLATEGGIAVLRGNLAPDGCVMKHTAMAPFLRHTGPESAMGVPLSLVRDGDLIELDVPARRLQWRVSDDEATRRHAEWEKAMGSDL